MDPTTKAGRDALRAVEEKATPGEWVSGSVLDGRPAGSVYEDRLGGRVCALSSDADAALIAAARNALIPALDRIDELEEKLREMTARALGHAYASSMAEGGEEIKAQELRRARADLEEVLAENRAYEQRAEAAEARVRELEDERDEWKGAAFLHRDNDAASMQRALTAERERDEARAKVAEWEGPLKQQVVDEYNELATRYAQANDRADALEKGGDVMGLTYEDIDVDAAYVAEKLAERVVLLREGIDWLAQTVHRAHHDGPLESCPKGTCAHARDVLARTA